VKTGITNGGDFRSLNNFGSVDAGKGRLREVGEPIDLYSTEIINNRCCPAFSAQGDTGLAG